MQTQTAGQNGKQTYMRHGWAIISKKTNTNRGCNLHRMSLDNDTMQEQDTMTKD